MQRWLTVVALCGLAALADGVPRLAGRPAAAAGPRLAATYGGLPLTFEANEGQVDGTVRSVLK
jgi:hypothetical protein